MSSSLLSVTVQKQPVGLILDGSNIGKQHLNWLLPRYYTVNRAIAAAAKRFDPQRSAAISNLNNSVS